MNNINKITEDFLAKKYLNVNSQNLISLNNINNEISQKAINFIVNSNNNNNFSGKIMKNFTFGINSAIPFFKNYKKSIR